MQARLGNPAPQDGLVGGSSQHPGGSHLYSAGSSSNLYRLKVINLPDALSERALVELFSQAGTVYEARIVHDKATGLPVGYGYVSYGSKEDADRAISCFDDQLQLEGAVGRLSVYYAKKQHSLKESSPARNAKLYFCGTPPGCKREDIVAMFSAYGRVRHLQVYMDSMGTLSSGTVTMFTAGEAIAAMTALDGVVPQDGTAPLKVSPHGQQAPQLPLCCCVPEAACGTGLRATCCHGAATSQQPPPCPDTLSQKAHLHATGALLSCCASLLVYCVHVA